MKRPLRDLIDEASPDAKGHALLQGLLRCASFGYLQLHKTRQFAYRMGLKSSARLPCKVISIGNITLGGTGKTPFAEKVARGLQKEGHRVAILSRGYGAQKRKDEVVVVSDETRIVSDFPRAGDEPLVLAKNCPGVPVIVARYRSEAGQKAVEEFGASVCVLDDGFQHWQLARDCDIVLLDASKPLRDLRIFPSGTLREPLSALRRADIVVLMEKDDQETQPGRMMEELQHMGFKGPIFSATYHAEALVPFSGSPVQSPESLRGKRVVAICGIAQPQSFFAMLRRCGADLVRTCAYDDHYIYQREDIETLRHVVQSLKPDIVVTTQKDFVRMVRHRTDDLPIHYLKIEVAFRPAEDEERLLSILRQVITGASRT
jgi:tetraacyldisaccharide 4'-kinase